MGKNGGKRPGAGRKPGGKNKRTLESEAAARVIVDNPDVRALWLDQAKRGDLPSVILQTLLYYAWGKPKERIEHSGDPDKPLVVRLRRAH